MNIRKHASRLALESMVTSSVVAVVVMIAICVVIAAFVIWPLAVLTVGLLVAITFIGMEWYSSLYESHKEILEQEERSRLRRERQRAKRGNHE